MKHYDREKKKYVTEEERDAKLKKREKCKGGRDHDYVEVLPWGAEMGDGYKGDPQPYYDAQEAIEKFTEKKYDELKEQGIIVKYRRPWHRSLEFRLFMCSVCHKRTSKSVKA